MCVGKKMWAMIIIVVLLGTSFAGLATVGKMEQNFGEKTKHTVGVEELISESENDVWNCTENMSTYDSEDGGFVNISSEDNMGPRMPGMPRMDVVRPGISYENSKPRMSNMKVRYPELHIKAPKPPKLEDLIGSNKIINRPLITETSENNYLRGVSGHITTDTTWSGVVYVSGNVTVDPGVTLTILPGTMVLFNKSTGLYVDGLLKANGTEDSPIIFTNSTATTAGFWKGIVVNDTSGGRFLYIQNATIDYPKVGLTVNYFSGGKTSSYIYNVSVSNTSSYGIYVTGYVWELNIIKSTITNSGDNGIDIEPYVKDTSWTMYLNVTSNVVNQSSGIGMFIAPVLDAQNKNSSMVAHIAIGNNTIYQSNEGIVVYSDAYSNGRNATAHYYVDVSGNVVHDNIWDGIIFWPWAYSSTALNITRWFGDITFENNTVYNNRWGIYVELEAPTDNGTSKMIASVDFKNNIAYNNEYGFEIVGDSYQTSAGRGLAAIDLNCNIENNAAYENSNGTIIYVFTDQNSENRTWANGTFSVQSNNIANNTYNGLGIYSGAYGTDAIAYADLSLNMYTNNISSNGNGTIFFAENNSYGLANTVGYIENNLIAYNKFSGIMGYMSNLVIKNNIIIKNREGVSKGIREIFFDGFESGTFDTRYWSWGASNLYGRVRVSSSYSHNGTYSALLDSSSSGSYTEAWLILHLDLSGTNNPWLDFYYRVFSNEDPCWVDISNDGITWYRVYDFPLHVSSSDFSHKYINLYQEAQNVGISASGDFYIRFYFCGNFPIPTDGIAIDDVRVRDMNSRNGYGIILMSGSVAKLYNNTISDNGVYGLYTDATSKADWEVYSLGYAWNNDIYMNGNVTIFNKGKLSWGNLTAQVWDVKVDGIMEAVNASHTIITHNVTVDGTLYLNGTTWKIDSTYDGQYHIEVTPTGHMVVQNLGTTPSNITRNRDVNYEFWIDQGAKFEVYNSEIHYVGWNNWSDEYKHLGLWLRSDDALLNNATITHNFVGIVIYKSSPNILNSTIAKNEKTGIYSQFSSAYIYGNTFYDSGNGDANGWNINVLMNTTSDTFIRNKVYFTSYISGRHYFDVRVYNPQHLIIRNNTLNNSYQGVTIAYGTADATLVIDRNMIYNNLLVGIVIFGDGNATITNNTLYNNGYGIDLLSSSDLGAGISYRGDYNLTYLSFGFESINGAENRNTLMKNIMAWFGNPDKVLLVDDDDGAGYESYYNASLDAIGYDSSKRNYWDVSKQGVPSNKTLEENGTVIWFTGNSWSTLSSAERDSIQEFLNHGGNLFISSPYMASDAYYNGWYSWFQQWMRARYYSSDLLFTVKGNGDEISDDMLLNIHPMIGDGAKYYYMDYYGGVWYGPRAVLAYNNSTEIFHYVDMSNQRIFNNTISSNDYSGVYVGYSNPIVKGNQIYGNGYHGISWVGRYSHETIIDNEIYENGWDGIYVYGLESVNLSSESVYGNEIYGNQERGIECYSPGPINITLTGQKNIITSNGYEGLYVYSEDFVRIALNNNITSNGRNGVYIYSSGDVQMNIWDTNISGNGYNGTAVIGSRITMKVTNSFFDSNNNHGAYLSGNSGGVTGEIINIMANSNGKDGFYVYNATGLTIQDSQFEGNGNNGLHLYTGSHVIVKNDIFEDNEVNGLLIAYASNINATQSQYYSNNVGIRVESSSYVNIWNNEIDYNSDSGIRIYSSDYMNVYNNDISYNDNYGIYISSSDDIDIYENTVNDNQNGIYISDGDLIQIYSNTIQTNENYGIRFDASWNSSVSKNTITYNYYDGVDIYNSYNITIDSNLISHNYLGVKASGSTVTVKDNEIVYNLGAADHDYTGGIWVESTQLTLINNDISYNIRYGIYSDSNSLVNWYVTADAKVTSNPVYIRGNIYVRDGGNMQIKGLNGEYPDHSPIGLFIRSERTNQFGIYVDSGGELIIEDSYITSLSENAYKFIVNGTMDMYGTVVEYLYTMKIRSSDVHISGSTITKAWYGGISVYDSTPIIENTKILNNTYFGIMLYRSTMSMETLDIEGNRVGILLNSVVGLVMESITLQSNEIGIKAIESSEFKMINSTLSNQRNDIYLMDSSVGWLLNTNFNEDSVIVKDTSTLSVNWYLTVSIVDRDGNPLSNVSVSVYNSSNALVDSDTTNILGLTKPFVVNEYIQTSTGITYSVPVTIVATLDNQTFSEGAMIKSSTTIQLAIGNRAPVITSTPVTEAVEDEEYSYTVIATDPDGDDLTYMLIEAPAGMTIDSKTGTITWIPTNDDVGTHEVIVRVSDGHGGYAEQKFTITVENVNDAPVITSIQVSPENGNSEMIYIFTVTYVDIDGDDPSHVYIVIDGKKYEMMPIGGTNATEGLIYMYKCSLSQGPHTYYFEAIDSNGTSTVTQGYTLFVNAPESHLYEYLLMALFIALIVLIIIDIYLWRHKKTNFNLKEKAEPVSEIEPVSEMNENKFDLKE